MQWNVGRIIYEKRSFQILIIAQTSYANEYKKCIWIVE